MRYHAMRLLSSLCLLSGVLARPAEAPPVADNIPDGVPDFAIKYAPLVWLHSQDPYLPSDLQAQLDNCVPKINLSSIPADANLPPLTLSNLNILNAYGQNGLDIFLTSKDDVTKLPQWLLGKKPSASNIIEGAKTGAVIVAERDAKTTDVFYMYFYAFNDGGRVMKINFGNHIGDWEHVMVRFEDKQPKYVWLSQHADGQAFTYAAVEKDPNGRPIAFSANGTHANYAVEGLHDHTMPQMHLSSEGLLTDFTDRGTLFDLTQSAYYYKWAAPPTPAAAVPPAGPATPAPLASGGQPQPQPQQAQKRDIDPATVALGEYTAYDPSHPTAWLYFRGHWGDQRYPDSDPRQYNVFKQFYRFEGGPTGPAFKEIGRKDVWSGGKPLMIWPIRGP